MSFVKNFQIYYRLFSFFGKGAENAFRIIKAAVTATLLPETTFVLLHGGIFAAYF